METAAADYIDPELIVSRLWDVFGYPRDTYFRRAVKHARILKLYYADLLDEMTGLSREDVVGCYDLFLSSYFLDDAFDSDRRPYALAVGMELYVRFVEFVDSRHPEARDVLGRLYAEQMRYQSVERDPGEEHGYSYEFMGSLDCYRMKQVILTFPLELMGEGRDAMEGILTDYYTCILLADDIADLAEDLPSGTRTPLTVAVASGEDTAQVTDRFRSLLEGKCASLEERVASAGLPDHTVKRTLDRLRSVAGIAPSPR